MKDRKEENCMPENERSGLERRVSMPPKELNDRPPMPPRRFEKGRGRGREGGCDALDDPRFRGPRERRDARQEEVSAEFAERREPGRRERRRPPVGGPGYDMRPPMGPPPGYGTMPPMGAGMPGMPYGYGGYMPPMGTVMMVPIMVVPVMYPGMAPGYQVMPAMPPMQPAGDQRYGIMRPPVSRDERYENEKDSSEVDNEEKEV